MPLNKDVLGVALYEALQDFQNKTPEEVGDIENFRLAFCKELAGAVIDHIKANAVVQMNVTVVVNTTGTATAQTGTGTGANTGTIE